MLNHPIIHLDGDAFFAACEVAKNPKLLGKPVVVGEDKGIATAMTYEAKRLGVTRGMPIFQVRKLFPQVTIVPTDFDTYGRFSKRVMNIVRRYVPRVEEYSIDECFGEFSRAGSSRESETASAKIKTIDYAKIARTIKDDIQTSLGITFSVGVAPTKVLAKVASKRNKPNGFTILEPENVAEYLSTVPIGGIWGIGPETTQKIRKSKISSSGLIETAGQFAAMPQHLVEKFFHRPVVEIWHELNGRSIFKIKTPDESEKRKSIQDTRSFRPPTGKRPFLLAELSRHTEEVCVRARLDGLVGNHVSFFLKTRGGQYFRAELSLDHYTALPQEIIPYIRRNLDSIFSPDILYKASGVTLTNLRPEFAALQNDLFGTSKRTQSSITVYRSVDEINRRFGDRAVMLASSMGGRAVHSLTMGETLPLPYLGEVK